MDKIIDALLAHNWTFETIFLFGFIFLVVPFKGNESALKSILNHFKNKKEFESQLIERYQAIANGLQEENNKLRDRITALETIIDQLRKTEDRQQEEINTLKIKLHNLGS